MINSLKSLQLASNVHSFSLALRQHLAVTIDDGALQRLGQQSRRSYFEVTYAAKWFLSDVLISLIAQTADRM